MWMRINEWRTLGLRAVKYVLKEWVRPAALVAAVVFPFKSAIADWNWVPSGSMKPTILEGDLVLVNKLAYDLKIPFTLTRLASWGDPRIGDIVVLFSPHDGTRLVKRVVGVPGDTLEMRDAMLIRNGHPLSYEVVPIDDFKDEIHESEHAVAANESDAGQVRRVMAFPDVVAQRSFAPVTLAAGRYFVMGDSRDNSFDSRSFGPVERASIVGRSRRVLLSFDKFHFYWPRFYRWIGRLDP